MKELSQRVAVVTGAASGIGFAMAQCFARENMSIVMADIEEGPLEAAATSIRENGVEVLARRVDVSKAEAIEHLAEETYARFGVAHILCNNAGVGGGGSQATLTVAEWDWVLGVNLHGVIHGIASFLPRMVASGEEGHIVNTASLAGHVGVPGMGPYNASKFAVVGLSESLYHEQIGSKIGVSVLCPGWVQTQIGQSGRNRPAGVPERPLGEGDAARSEFIRQAIATGLAPSEIAAMVRDAIVANRFWIFSHPESMASIQQRTNEILTSTNPISLRPNPPPSPV